MLARVADVTRGYCPVHPTFVNDCPHWLKIDEGTVVVAVMVGGVMNGGF